MLELNDSAKRGKGLKIIIMGVTLIGMLALVGWLVWDSGFFDSETATPVALLSKPGAKPAAKTAAKPTSVVPATPASGKSGASAAPVVPAASVQNYLHSAGNTKQITELLSELEVKKLEYAISELEQKTQNLNAPALPDIRPDMKPDMRIVTPTMLAPPSVTAPKIISIEGVDGKLQAVLQTSSGRKTAYSSLKLKRPSLF